MAKKKIAQESGFDPHALSKANALGLTQVSHLAEADIPPHFPGWPRYPGIEAFSRRKLRKMIPESIHGGNEWRLDPVKSIWGGAHYLAYLRDRLSADENRRRAGGTGEAWEPLLTEAALASYNSGLNRILYHLDRYGARWLEQPTTREAKRYVRQILSYYGAISGIRGRRAAPRGGGVVTGLVRKPPWVGLGSWILWGVALSIPVQVMVLLGHPPAEFKAIWAKPAPQNKAVMGLAVLAALGLGRVSPGAGGRRWASRRSPSGNPPPRGS